mmetsp:Transcript_17342/g.38185  ORF Transcript_17342/g.38185 Transcript_17342/m.38185 type:complete len:389 (+) Transcript_17342:3-1169(+)
MACPTGPLPSFPTLTFNPAAGDCSGGGGGGETGGDAGAGTGAVATAEDDEGGDFVGIIIGVLIGALAILACGCYIVHRIASKSKGASKIAGESPAPSMYPSSQSAFPGYWSPASAAGGSLCVIPVDNATRQRLGLLLNVSDPSQLGQGRDASSYHHAYSALVLHAAWRLEHPDLWQLFSTRRDVVARQVLDFRNKRLPEVPINTATQSVGEVLPGPVRADANEVWLLHGCKPDHALAIIQTGLNEKLCSLGGAFGAGIYLAEDAAKIDQYTSPDSNYKQAGLEGLHRCLFQNGVRHPDEDLFYCFVVRCVAGWPIRTKDGKTNLDDRSVSIHHDGDRRELAEIKGVEGHARYNSLIVEKGAAVKRFREFVVFDSTQTYCEYILAYRRV